MNGKFEKSPKKTVGFKTFGCKINQYDTDFLREAFQKAGYEVVDEGPSDLLVVNTCAVTAKSAAKCRQAIRTGARQGSKVLVTGCYPQVAKEEVQDIPGVFVVTGVLNRKDLVSLADEALERGEKIVRVERHSKGEKFDETPVRQPSLTRAYLKIQEGCNDFCTYCIVPYARGPSRSREPESVLEEAQALLEKGHKEIVLTGTHLGLYGKDLGKDLGGCWDLPRIIEEICRLDGLIRLRLSSLEPHDVTDRLIECLRLPNVCHHLHLPLQSGSNKILRKMGRPYISEGFLETAQKARKVAPDLGLSTDIIVGFPGEDEKDFRDTVEVAKKVAFSRLHVFRYSERPGTPASLMAEKVPGHEKAEREKELLALGKELSLSFYRKNVNRVLEVVVEEERTREGHLSGMTRNYIRCFLSGEDRLKGQVISVIGRKAIEEGLWCENSDTSGGVDFGIAASRLGIRRKVGRA